MLIGMLLRTHFSLHHAQMAAYHARIAADLQLDGSEEIAIAIGAHVSGAVISAGAFIEATANELSENDKRPREIIPGQPASLLRLNELLKGAKASPFGHDDTKWQAAQTLIELRNRLIHYKYDWLDLGTKNMIGRDNLHDSTLGPRLEASFEFLPVSMHYIPSFLSPDCAAWAINSATQFLDEFYRRLGKTPRHDHLRHRIEVQRSAAKGPAQQL
ncbi:hypothetical protein [[Pseudomonas] boreopolis]|uniref:Uncharacterized protein n=1 Tax=Xanthomonas boreopolis TaxID=86183 RepID=A0A919FB33_9XANT|nr:hypothetical protein GCM10009090_33140 [[Pseudomonas] boreopolis]